MNEELFQLTAVSSGAERVERIRVFGRAGRGSLLELGVIEVGENDTPADVNRTLAAFYRGLADSLEREADEQEVVE